MIRKDLFNILVDFFRKRYNWSWIESMDFVSGDLRKAEQIYLEIKGREIKNYKRK